MHCTAATHTYHVVVIEEVDTAIDAVEHDKHLFSAAGVGIVANVGWLDEIDFVAVAQFLLQDIVAMLGVRDAEEGNHGCIVNAHIAMQGLDIAVDLWLV